MAPKKVPEVLGEVTPPRDSSPTSGVGEKKKDDTTPTPVVDKDVTPSEDDKKKKDTSSTAPKGSSKGGTTTSKSAGRTSDLTELSPSREARSIGKRKDMERGRGGGGRGVKKSLRKTQSLFNKKMMALRKTQSLKAKKQKHPRSLAYQIKRILLSVNETQEQEAVVPKRVSPLAMMIFDSFANDLCEKMIATGVELIKNSGKRQLGSGEIKAAMKLVLPADMAGCAEEAVQASLVSYKESTKKYQGNIAKAKGTKKAAMGTKKD